MHRNELRPLFTIFILFTLLLATCLFLTAFATTTTVSTADTADKVEEGHLIWEKSYKLWTSCRPIGALSEPDGGLLVIIQDLNLHRKSDPHQTIFLKINGAGQKVWHKRIDIKGQPSITVKTGNGDIIIGGEIGKKPSKLFIAKVDREGQILWNRTYENRYDTQIRGITQTRDGYIIIGTILTTEERQIIDGNRTHTTSGDVFKIHLLKINALGEKIWEKTLQTPPHVMHQDLSCVADCGDGTTILATTRDLPNQGPMRENLALIKIDQRGEIQWEKEHPNQSKSPTSIDTISSGGYILVGKKWVEQRIDHLFIARYDQEGDPVWEKEYPSPRDDYPTKILAQKPEGYLLSLLSYDPDTYVAEASILKLSPEGGIEWGIRRYLPEEGVSADLILETSPSEIYMIGRKSAIYRLDIYIARIERTTAMATLSITLEASESTQPQSSNRIYLIAQDLPPSQKLHLYIAPIHHDPDRPDLVGRKIQTSPQGYIESTPLVTQGPGLYQAFIDLDDDQHRDINEPSCWFMEIPRNPIQTLISIITPATLAALVTIIPITIVLSALATNTNPLKKGIKKNQANTPSTPTTPTRNKNRSKAKKTLLILGIILLTISAYLTIIGIGRMGIVTRMTGMGKTVEPVQGGEPMMIDNGKDYFLTQHVTRHGELPKGLEAWKWLRIPQLSWALTNLIIGTMCIAMAQGMKIRPSRPGPGLKTGIIAKLGTFIIAIGLLNLTYLIIEEVNALYYRGWGFWLSLTLITTGTILILLGVSTQIIRRK